MHWQRASLTGNDLNAYGIHVGDVSMEMHLTEDRRVRLTHFDAGLKKRISGHGFADLETGYVRANVFPKEINLGCTQRHLPKSVDAFNESRLTGNARLLVNGLFRIPSYEVQTELRVETQMVIPMALRTGSTSPLMPHRDDAVGINYLRLNDGRTEGTLDGEFDLDTYVMAFKGKLSARNIRPMTRSFGQDIGGRVDQNQG